MKLTKLALGIVLLGIVLLGTMSTTLSAGNSCKYVQKEVDWFTNCLLVDVAQNQTFEAFAPCRSALLDYKKQMSVCKKSMTPKAYNKKMKVINKALAVKEYQY